MAIRRIVPNLPVADVGRANEVYSTVLGLEVGMDLGWVGNLAPTGAPNVQLQVATADATAPRLPDISVGVDSVAEVDEIHQRVLAAGLVVIHGPADEEWGVHRFFFEDPDGNVINVVAHR